MILDTKKTRIVSTIAFITMAVIFLTANAHGQSMSSSNYKIQSDSVNFGGVRSTSTTYGLEDTLGEVATGISSSTNYTMKAGYQQMQESVIAVVPAGNVIMSPSIAGITGGTANGATTFTVTTDNQAGYTATIKASSSPALASALDSFADYVPAGANPDFTFSIDASASEFAFSPEGADTDQRFKDNGASCNTGSSETSLSCWDGLSTSPKTIVTRTTANHTADTVTTIRFRAASGGSHLQIDGQYTATSTLTVIPL